MNIKYNIQIDNIIIKNSFDKIINQTYKLLPLREEKQDWKKPLQTVIQELVGLKRLLKIEQRLFFLILCKMEGLFSLNKEKDMILYRRIIFECLGLLNSLKQKCQNQEL